MAAKKNKKIKDQATDFEGKVVLFDSDLEKFMYWWLKELEGEGLISHITKGKSYKLCDAVIKVVNGKEVVFLEDRIYTPDFEFTVKNGTKWFDDFNNPTISPTSRKDYALYHQDFKVVIEVKPGAYDMQNMTRVFKLNQKDLYAKHGIFVNLVKVPDIFKKTFTPRKYLKTETGKDRKINFPINLL